MPRARTRIFRRDRRRRRRRCYYTILSSIIATRAYWRERKKTNERTVCLKNVSRTCVDCRRFVIFFFSIVITAAEWAIITITITIIITTTTIGRSGYDVVLNLKTRRRTRRSRRRRTGERVRRAANDGRLLPAYACSGGGGGGGPGPDAWARGRRRRWGRARATVHESGGVRRRTRWGAVGGRAAAAAAAVMGVTAGDRGWAATGSGNQTAHWPVARAAGRARRVYFWTVVVDR